MRDDTIAKCMYVCILAGFRSGLERPVGPIVWESESAQLERLIFNGLK